MVEEFVESILANTELVQNLYMELNALKGSKDLNKIQKLKNEIEAATTILTNKDMPVLTALNSNNLAFNIFSYFP